MSSFCFVKFKSKFPTKYNRVCGFTTSQAPTALEMLSFIQRVVRQALILRQGAFTKTKLNNIGKQQTAGPLNPTGTGQTTKVRLNNSLGSSANSSSSNAIALAVKNSNANFIQFIIGSVAGTVRQVFITNVLRRNNLLTNPILQRFGNNSRPFFGLVGIGLVTGGKTLTEDYQFEDVCAEIRHTLRPVKEDYLAEIELDELEEKAKEPIDSLEWGRIIGQGQCGAIYAAKLKEKDVAVKVMFNFSHQSNSPTILRGMMRELIPSKQRIKGLDFGDTKKCSAHPNIVDIKCVLVSRNVSLPGAAEHWPAALPPTLNIGGYGRNMTMYVVMEQYDADLETFLRNHHDDLSLRQRVIILSQMLEGVTHLKKQGIAHRDLKADNFLVKHKNLDYPHIVITDFGFCLASKRNPMQLQYSCEDIAIGGNAALLAPELATATPGTFKWLNYEHSDTWAVGSVAYQVLGSENPFYDQLSSADYKEEDLPPLDESIPKVVQNVVQGLLKRSPRERLSSELAAVICYIFLWGPRKWLSRGKYSKVADIEIMRWLMMLTTKVVGHSGVGSEMNLINTFLQRVNYNDVHRAVGFCQQL